MEAPLPENEKERLDVLRQYRILDTPEEHDFDDLVRLAAQICQTPISLVSLVDRDRQWFKGRFGLDISETPRRISFCAHAILQAPQTMVVPDATLDPRFADNELVREGPRIRAYASAPLVSPEGHALGTLCVIDTQPREFTTEQREALRILGRQVLTQLELRRRLAQLEFRANETNFHMLFEQATDGIFVSDLQGHYLDVNSAACHMLGYAREELLRLSIADVVAPEEIPRIAVEIPGPANGHIVRSEWRFKRKDGSCFPGEVVAKQLPDGRLQAFVRDVSQRKQAEAVMKESMLRIQQAVRAGNVGLWDWDLRTDQIYFSPEWKRQIGCDEDEIDNDIKEWRERVHPEDLDQFLTTIRAFLDKPWPDFKVEFRFRHKDGSYRWILSQASLIHDDQGRAIRMLGSHLDITERKWHEAALRELSAHLLQAQDIERRRISRELHDTTAQHLAALTLNLNQLKRLAVPSIPQAGEICADSIRLAKQAAQEIRTHSYLLHPPLLEAMGLGAAIDDYVQGFAARSGIRVEVEFSPNFGRLPEEMELALMRVVQESLANVLRHSGSSEAKISFTRQESRVGLEVRDRGKGIPEDQLARIRTMKSGIGVGLGGMQERLRLLGGRLEVDSGPSGTTIRAILPVRESNAQSISPSISSL